MSDSPALIPPSTPWRLALELGTTTLATSSAMLLGAKVVNALGSNPAGRSFSTTERFTLLGNSADPLIAAMALAAVVAAITLRSPSSGGSRFKASGWVVVAAGAVGLVTAVLCLNGILLDLTSSTTSGLVRVATVLYRLGMLALAGGTLWIAFSATAKTPVEIGTAVTIERQPSVLGPISTDSSPKEDPEASQPTSDSAQ